jgi:hypothetical protein
MLEGESRNPIRFNRGLRNAGVARNRRSCFTTELFMTLRFTPEDENSAC